ncbi:hypothetical protein ACFLTB_01880 [Chloroflexota bacterium]
MCTVLIVRFGIGYKICLFVSILVLDCSPESGENIGLNIIMLDDGPELKSLASTIAKKNLGRVFFTTPSKLGEVLVEDYLKGRREGSLAQRD